MTDPLRNLQALRAFACLWVAWFHTFCPAFNVGQFGVDVFFVISGFIMSQVCATRPEQFFVRRVIRVVPVYWFYTLAIFGAAVVVPRLLVSVTPNLSNLFQSLFFIPYVRENGLINPMVPQGWTLNYEMYFYLLVALSLRVVRPALATTLASGGLLAIAAGLGLWGKGTAALFYSNLIVGEFCLGVLTYGIWSRVRSRPGPPPALLLGLIVVSCAALIAAESFRLHQTLPTGRLLAFGVPSFVLVSSALLLERHRSVKNRAVQLIGDASYSIYLSHLFVIELLGRLIGRRVPVLAPGHPVGALVAMAMVLVVGLASYLLLEVRLTSFLKRRWSQSNPKPASETPPS